jgi:cyclase
MTAKRVIACVHVKDGRLLAPVGIPGQLDATDPVEAALSLAKAGADEVYVLDATASLDGRPPAVALVRRIAQKTRVPIVLGGGVRTISDAREIFEAGAARVAVNTAAVENSEIISDLSGEFGSERVVIAIDARNEGAGWTVHTHTGTRNTHIDAITWGQETEAQGAGEMLLTSLDRTGTRTGYDVDLVHAVGDEVEIPVLAAGGAGTLEHFAAVLQGEKPAGAVAASVFLSGKLTVRAVKEHLRSRGIEVVPES